MAIRIYGNRSLKTLPGQTTRPTVSRVREALFQIWQGVIGGCRWLDICAGSGSMGAEALARGAALVVGVEQLPQACGVIRDNWQRIARSPQRFEIVRGDAPRVLARLRGQRFDRIYFDPPYAGDLYESVLQVVAEAQLLAEAGECAVEFNPRQWQPPLQVGQLRCDRVKTYGNCALAFYGWSEAIAIEETQNLG